MNKELVSHTFKNIGVKQIIDEIDKEEGIIMNIAVRASC